VHDPPPEQVWPVVVQSLHVAPRVPHVALLVFMQLPPWQHPLRQLRRLQFPPPPPLLLLDDELPLLDPDDELPLLLDDMGPEQTPVWHDWLVPVQSTHDAPFNPHAESSRPTLQLPAESQQPPQMAGQPPPSSPLSSPSSLVVASSPAAAPSSPLVALPELLAPLLLL
jgi:hypothetical protein